MLSSHQQKSAQGEKSRLLVTVIGGLAFFAASLFASAFAQSSADLSATRNWLEGKKSDPALTVLLVDKGADPCASTGGIAFDPVACIGSYLKKWLGIQKIAESDPQTSPAVKNTTALIVDGLRNAESKWKSTPPALRSQQIASRQQLLDEVEKSGGDVKRALQNLENAQRNNPQMHEVAASLVGTNIRSAPHGGPFCFRTCYCVWAEGCPCCASTMINDLKIGR
jgi:hypothetical protein